MPSYSPRSLHTPATQPDSYSSLTYCSRAECGGHLEQASYADRRPGAHIMQIRSNCQPVPHLCPGMGAVPAKIFLEGGLFSDLPTRENSLKCTCPTLTSFSLSVLWVLTGDPGLGLEEMRHVPKGPIPSGWQWLYRNCYFCGECDRVKFPA